LQKAVDRPGSIEIPESTPITTPPPIVEIPAADPETAAASTKRDSGL